MIKVVFDGGLGNQMFLYAYVYAQIKENHLDERIYAVMNRNKDEDRRDFALNSLNCSLKMEVVDKKNTEFLLKNKINFREQLCRVLQKIKIRDEVITRILKSFNICYTPAVFKYYPNLKLKNDSYVEGNFQTWKYFQKYEKQIKNEFKVTKEISPENKKMLDQIHSTNSVCVHIRRGDYINTRYSKFLQICDYEYYRNAMEYISSKIENPSFYIFSNSHKDHEWIKKNYKFNFNVVHIDLDNPDYEELRLMTSCKHFIISNSTFSWWAQYLSTNENKMVVAPAKWHLDKNVNYEDIYMPNWKKIDV